LGDCEWCSGVLAGSCARVRGTWRAWCGCRDAWCWCGRRLLFAEFRCRRKRLQFRIHIHSPIIHIPIPIHILINSLSRTLLDSLKLTPSTTSHTFPISPPRTLLHPLTSLHASLPTCSLGFCSALNPTRSLYPGLYNPPSTRSHP